MVYRESVVRTREEMIVEVWQELDCPPVGAEEIEEIQRELRERFGAGGILLPMRIARVLVEVGAELMHPDVIELDAKQRAATFEARDPGFELDFDGLRQAEETLAMLEALRSKACESNELQMYPKARGSVRHVRERLCTDSSNPAIDESS